MCGRYQLDDDMKAIIERFDIESIFNHAYIKTGEIFPTDRVPVVVNTDGRNGIKILRWGIKPVFMNKDIINTRRESLFEKKMFIRPIYEGRCIIPANSFYEWEKTDYGKKRRTIYLGEEKIIALAGICMNVYDKDKGMFDESFSILTREAPDHFRKIHDRIPVMLRRMDEAQWLGGVLTREMIEQIIERSYSDMKIA
jgi:putative SOS response-associated peptidase YedK